MTSNFFKTINNTIKHWYIPFIIGLLLIFLGIYIFTVPLETYAALTIVFSVSFLAAGILEIVFSIQNRNEVEGWAWFLIGGIIDFYIGLYLVIYPEISAITLPIFVGFTLMFRSFQGLGFSFDLKNYGIQNWGNLAIFSILGIIFSFLLLANPLFTGSFLVSLTALSFIFSGFSAISLSLSLKKVKDFPQKISSELKDKINELKQEYHKQINDRK